MSLSSETWLKLSLQWDDTMRALQFKPNFFWLWCHPQPIVVNTTRGSCSVLSDHCVVILPFLPFSSPLCRRKCSSYVPFTTLCLRSDERKAFPLVCTWPAAFFNKLDGVVVGQGGEMVFDEDKNEGVPRWFCGLAFLMGSNPERNQTVWVLGREPPPFFWQLLPSALMAF